MGEINWGGLLDLDLKLRSNYKYLVGCRCRKWLVGVVVFAATKIRGISAKQNSNANPNSP